VHDRFLQAHPGGQHDDRGGYGGATALRAESIAVRWRGRAGYGLTVAVKICDVRLLTALPQLSWIFRGLCAGAGSMEMPMVSPGQMLRLPNWRETWIGPPSHPVWMENGRRYWAKPRGELSDSHPT